MFKLNADGVQIKCRTRPPQFDEIQNAKDPVSPRPTHSALDLKKIEATGYPALDWEESLKKYVAKELAE